MAERRMFSKSVIDSDKFLEMPITSQLLYFHLSMRADDDGFIDKAKSIMRLTGCKDDDIKLLIANEYIIPFDSGVVAIKHWKAHNYIQKDRYRPTVYQEEMSRLTVNESNVYNLDTECIQVVSNLDTQVRLGKDRLVKDRSGESESENENEPDGSTLTRNTHGEYNHVQLTDDEYSLLVKDYGKAKTDDYITKVDEYCEQYGRSYKNYNLTIRNWIKEDSKKREPAKSDKTEQKSSRSFDLEEWERFARNLDLSTIHL